MTASLAVVQPQADLTAIERVIVAGDLSKLTPDERWNYYRGVCQSVGLNPFTQPFLYITLSGKLVLYATKGAADQLRSNHHISISQPHMDLTDGLCIVTVTATDRTGRTDSDLGIVPCENLRGDAKANAILKAVTKAKRRVTLSMCGLGMLDETEIETIPNARPLPLEEAHGQAPQQAAPLTIANGTAANSGPASPDFRASFEKNWKRGTQAAAKCGAAIPDKPGEDASEANLDKALREFSGEVVARQKLNEELTTRTARVRELGGDVADLEPANMKTVEVYAVLEALAAMITAGEADQDAPADETADDDTDAPF